MKRTVISLIIIASIVLGLIYGPRLNTYDGYILLVTETATVQLSVFGAVLTLIGAMLTVWLVYKVLQLVYHIVFNTKDFFTNFSQRKRHKAFNRGIADLLNGHPHLASDSLGKIRDADFGGLNLLALGEAKKLMGENQEAEQLFVKALDSTVQAQALEALYRLYLQQNTPEKLLSDIQTRSNKLANNPQIIKLHANALAHARRWKTLEDNLSGWKKALGDDYQYWKQQLLAGTFAEVASKEGAIELKNTWDGLPRSVRKDPNQQVAYIQQLIDQGMHQDAQDALVKYATFRQHTMYLPLFKQLRLSSPVASLKLLEEWIKQDDTNALLFSTLGHLAYHAKDLILAEKATAKAVTLADRREDVLLLAQINEAQNNEHQAMTLYKKSVSSH